MRNLIAFDGLYIIDLNGRVLSRPPNGGYLGSSPSWSPNGEWLVYAVDKHCTPPLEPGLFIVKKDGSHRHRISTGTDNSPCWHHDQQITFSRTFLSRRGGFVEVSYVDIISINPQSRTLNLIFRVMDATDSVGLACNGDRVAFTYETQQKGSSLHILGPESPSPRTVTTLGNYCRYPCWERTGQSLLFCGKDWLYTMSVNGLNIKRLPIRNTTGDRACWSPDDTKIVFLKAVNRHEVAICVASADGASTRQLFPAEGGSKRGFGLDW